MWNEKLIIISFILCFCSGFFLGWMASTMMKNIRAYTNHESHLAVEMQKMSALMSEYKSNLEKHQANKTAGK